MAEKPQRPRIFKNWFLRLVFLFLLAFLASVLLFSTSLNKKDDRLRIEASDDLLFPEMPEQIPESDPIFEIPNEKCGWWYQRLNNWKSRWRKGRIPFHMTAVQEHSGFGDRVHGLITAVQHAISFNKTLEISWENLDALFTTPDFLPTEMLSISGSKKLIKTNQCKAKSYYSCDAMEHKTDDCPVYNRACVNWSYCKQMKAFNKKKGMDEELNMKQVVGCPMRLLLQPQQSFFNTNIKFFFEGRVREDTIWSLIKVFRESFVVSVHLRLGDKSLREGKVDLKKITDLLSDFKNCISSVEDRNEATKPIRWFIASDDEAVREHFRTFFPEKSIVLMSKPQHIQHFVSKDAIQRRDDAKQVFAEWFLLGQGNELVVNDAHIFGASAFSRSAWLYNMKDEYFLLRKMFDDKSGTRLKTRKDQDICVRKKFEYEGSLRRISKHCH